MRRRLISCFLSAALFGSSSAILADDPRLCEVNFVTGRKTCGITLREAREVRSVIRTIPGINHELIFIDALALPDVRVHTGREEDKHGDVVYLRRQGSRWTVRERLYWSEEDGLVSEHK